MKKILVVEDEGIVRKDIGDRLKGLGYEVCTVSSGEEAIEVCGSFLPDLVLMDIMLQKGIDGITAASRVNDRYSVPVVYLTAYADSPTLDRAKVTNPYGYILKPFEERELRTNIEMALHKHSLERKLKESRQWFFAILNSLGEGVVASDGTGRIIFMNPFAETLSGWSEEDARGKPLDEVVRLSGPGGVVSLGSIKERLSLQDAVLTDRNGSDIPVDAGLSPLQDAGAGTGMVLVCRDISERKKARDQLFQASKMAAIGTLAGGVAHEFNNLISIMRSKSELALMDGDHLSAVEACRSVMVATERAQKIVQSLLSFSRRIKPSLERARLADLMEETMFLLEREMAKQSIRIVKEYSPVCPLMLDAGQIQQVFLNLLVNAKEAMSSGGRLTIRIYESGDCQFVEIGDTGTGISRENIGRIFEPFFTTKQAMRSGFPGGGGTGLGLSVSMGIVENHGGELGVSSGAGGTCFTIRLPMDKEVSQSKQ